METGYDVLIKVNENNEITEITSSAFFENEEECEERYIVIDHGVGDKYHHAQGNYIDNTLIDSQGRYLWRWTGEAVERIPDAELPKTDEQTPAESDEIEALKAQVADLKSRAEFSEGALTELILTIYSATSE